MAKLREKFILNSDYPVDKIVWLKEGDATMDAWGNINITLPHTVGAQIYVNGVWTIDDWTTTYNFSAQRQVAQGYEYQATAKATDSTVKISAAHENGANKTFKYRLWGFISEESSKGIEIKPTAGQSANRLVFSSDYEYPMLYKEGIATPGTTIAHGLGEIPYVDVWGKMQNDTGYSIVSGDCFGEVYGYGENIKITANEVIFKSTAPLYESYYYRIYLP